MKIGIMGGTFDPVHNGHLMLAHYALTQFELDKIWFLPNGRPPHKRSQHTENRLQHRLDMLRLAIAGEEKFELCTYEADRKETSYSYETMEALHEQYPEHEFYFIVGADSVMGLEMWRHPERLAKMCKFLAACRDDIDVFKMHAQMQHLSDMFGAKIYFLKTPAVPVSSSVIREQIEAGEAADGLVPEAVMDYIREQHLYEGE